MRNFLALVIALLLAGAARAQPASNGQVELRAVPADASVFDQGGYLGRADALVPLHSANSYDGGMVELRLHAPGYGWATLVLKSAEVGTGVYRHPETIYLPPESLPAYVNYYKFTLATAVLLLAGAGLGLRRMRKLHRTQAVMNQSMSLLTNVIPGRLGPYQVVGELGRGGMGTVVKAVPADDPKAEPVAIKVLHVSGDQVADLLPRLKREVDLYRMLRHANIVTMLDYGQQDALIYLVLELIDGGTLTPYLRKSGCSPEEALRYLKPLFAAVEYAHGKGVVHRDLKPDNVMLTARGVLKVTDFGLGRSLTSETLTRSGDILGTPAYMAPEQICGTRFEPATDQYALGVIAFELIAGRRPFESGDPMGVVFLHVSEAPPSLFDFRPGVPERLDQAVLRMLAKVPVQRFPSVEAAWVELEAGIQEWARA